MTRFVRSERALDGRSSPLLTRRTIARLTHAFFVFVLVACSTGEEGAFSGPPATGDPNPTGLPPGAICVANGDCRTGVCANARCQTATNTDGVRNGDESDVDCGGSEGPSCAPGKLCVADENCVSGVCTDFICSGTPEPRCGGTEDLPRCDDGKPCTAHSDCKSGTCTAGICVVFGLDDGVKNAGETDIDCGGPRVKKCGVGEDCLTGNDCTSGVCTNATKTCAAPSLHDKVKNGDETDIDCGGPPPAKRCGPGQGCKAHSDCTTDGCGFDGTCALSATCTQLEGGQTCGPIDTLTKQEDCCTRAKVGSYTIDKYLVTAGRMRAFLERLNGKVRDWAASLPPERWNPEWTPYLPNSIEGIPGDGNNANTQLGPFWGKRSCETGYHTGHTFWTPPAYGDTKHFPKNVLDAKALNCVPWWLLAALCVFDGGHLLTEAELRAAYTNDGKTPFPWGARGDYTTAASNEYAVQLWGYWTPNPPPNAPHDNNEYFDIAFNIAAPGRRPAGYNFTGHADLVGNLLEWMGDSERQFAWKGSFENHAHEADAFLAPPVDDDPFVTMRTPEIPWRWHDVVENAADSGNVNGYYAIGGRCGY